MESREQLEARIRDLSSELTTLRKKLADEVARREMTQRALEGLSRQDSLTMLPNRGMFMEILRDAVKALNAESPQLAVISVNIDGFRTINEGMGHTVGDLLLREVSERIRTCLRNSDTAGRLGGDDFLILVTPMETPTTAEEVANAIIRSANEPFMLAGHPCTIGLRAGIGLVPDHATDAEAVIQCAEQAMKQATDGANIVVYSPPAAA